MSCPVELKCPIRRFKTEVPVGSLSIFVSFFNLMYVANIL